MGDFEIDPEAEYVVVPDTGCPGADAALGAILEDYGATQVEVDIGELEK